MNLIKIEVVDYETSVISVERLVLYSNVIFNTNSDRYYWYGTLDHCTFDKYYW